MYDIIELYLNSSVCENHAKYYCAKAGKGLFAKFTLGDIRQLPLPKIENIQPQMFEEATHLLSSLRSRDISPKQLIEVDLFVADLYNVDAKK